MTCKSCARNLLGYCTQYERHIPPGKESVNHDCSAWLPAREDDITQVLTGLIETHPEHRDTWWTVRDMVAGDVTPPAGSRAAAWRLLWTARYIDDAVRVMIAKEIVPFGKSQF